MNRLRGIFQLFVNGFVWIVVAGFIGWCLVSAVVEFLAKALSLNAFINTPAHARVAFYYNTLHNRCVRSLVGGLVCLTNLYNQAFSEMYLVLVKESIADIDTADASQPRNSIVISSFRFGIEKPAPRQNREYSWKKFWQLPQETHDVSWFVLDWQLRNNITIEFKVYRWKALSRQRWLRLCVSSSGVLKHSHPYNTGVWFYTEEQVQGQYQRVVRFPRVVGALFAPKEYGMVHFGLYIVNGMHRAGYFTAVYDIQYVALEDAALNRPFCVLCLIMGISAPYPPKPTLLHKPVHKIPTLEYIKWGILNFPFGHNHEAVIDQAQQQAMQELQPHINAYCTVEHIQRETEITY